MNKTQRLELILDHIGEIELLQPGTLGIDADFSVLEDIHDQINAILNPDIYGDSDDE
jgi:hypothetical protein